MIGCDHQGEGAAVYWPPVLQLQWPIACQLVTAPSLHVHGNERQQKLRTLQAHQGVGLAGVHLSSSCHSAQQVMPLQHGQLTGHDPPGYYWGQAPLVASGVHLVG